MALSIKEYKNGFKARRLKKAKNDARFNNRYFETRSKLLKNKKFERDLIFYL